MFAYQTVDHLSFSEQLIKYRIETEEQAIELEEHLVEILDEVAGGNEHLRPYMEFLEDTLERYKNALHEKVASGAEMLRFLMNQHGHVQQDLAHLISRSTVSELLNGKREFTVEHMKKLGTFYHLPPRVFLGE